MRAKEGRTVDQQERVRRHNLRVYKAHERLKRAAVRYWKVGTRAATPENEKEFHRSQAALDSAALFYAAAVSPKTTR